MHQTLSISYYAVTLHTLMPIFNMLVTKFHMTRSWFCYWNGTSDLIWSNKSISMYLTGDKDNTTTCITNPYLAKLIIFELSPTWSCVSLPLPTTSNKLEMLYFFQCRDRLSTSKSDVHWCQILTSKVVPGALRVKRPDYVCSQKQATPHNYNLNVK